MITGAGPHEVRWVSSLSLPGLRESVLQANQALVKAALKPSSSGFDL
jgi:hypothetical protein